MTIGSSIGDEYLSNDNISQNYSYQPIPSKLAYDMIMSDTPNVNNNNNDKQFSNLFEETLIINCDTEQTPMIAEFDQLLYHNQPMKELNKFKPIKSKINDGNIFIHSLKRKTQLVITKCNDLFEMQLSMKSLFNFNYRSYKHKKQTIKDQFDINNNIPPNIVIFVIKSMSRSNFIRSFPMTVDYLSKLMINQKSKTSVLQFFVLAPSDSAEMSI